MEDTKRSLIEAMRLADCTKYGPDGFIVPTTLTAQVDARAYDEMSEWASQQTWPEGMYLRIEIADYFHFMNKVDFTNILDVMAVDIERKALAYEKKTIQSREYLERIKKEFEELGKIQINTTDRPAYATVKIGILRSQATLNMIRSQLGEYDDGTWQQDQLKSVMIKISGRGD